MIPKPHFLLFLIILVAPEFISALHGKGYGTRKTKFKEKLTTKMVKYSDKDWINNYRQFFMDLFGLNIYGTNQMRLTKEGGNRLPLVLLRYLRIQLHARKKTEIIPNNVIYLTHAHLVMISKLS
jgi:hypothetical protein